MLSLSMRAAYVQVCDDLLSQSVLDEAALHPLRITLKDLDRSQDIIRMYETATRQDPNNVELLEALFAAYSRHVLCLPVIVML